MLFTILFVIALVAAVSFLVIKVQKNKAEQAKCPFPHEELAPEATPAPVAEKIAKKKAAKKKPTAKKTNSSQKKK